MSLEELKNLLMELIGRASELGDFMKFIEEAESTKTLDKKTQGVDVTSHWNSDKV